MNIKSALNGLCNRTRGKFTFDNPSVNEGCNEFEVNNWTISKFVVNVLIPIVDVHPFPLNEQMLMVSAVCRVKPTHIFEWGTHIGKSARIFFETCKAFRIEAEIHSVDLPEDVEHVEHPGEKRGSLVRGIREVKLHQGDGLEKSLEIAKGCAPGPFRPLFFIDGDHSYDSVKRELVGIIQNVPQADILLHDTFYQSEESGYNIGPYKAMNDVLASKKNRFKMLSQNLGLPGMTLLWQTK